MAIFTDRDDNRAIRVSRFGDIIGIDVKNSYDATFIVLNYDLDTAREIGEKLLELVEDATEEAYLDDDAWDDEDELDDDTDDAFGPISDLRAGDKVRVIDDSKSKVDLGSIGVVEGWVLILGIPTVLVLFDGTFHQFFSPNRIEKVTDDEPLTLDDIPVGTKVRVIDGFGHHFDIGDVGQVTGHQDGKHIQVEVPGICYTQTLDLDQVEIV